MKRFFYAAVVVVVASMALAAFASASVPRYQTQTGMLTANVLGGSYVHTYTITISPCDNSFVGSGGIASLGLAENVSGTLTGPSLTFNSMYLGAWAPYAWSYNGPLTGGIGFGPGGQTFPVVFTLGTMTASTWTNHGDYVSRSTDKEAAAHSCIGMPIH